MKMVEHTSEKTFKTEEDALSAIKWIMDNLYKGKDVSEEYKIVEIDGGFKYVVMFEPEEENPVLFHNQKLIDMVVE